MNIPSNTPVPNDLDFGKIISVENLVINYNIVPSRCILELKTLIFSKLTDMTDIYKKTYRYSDSELPLKNSGYVYIVNKHTYNKASKKELNSPYICCYTKNPVIKETLFVSMQHELAKYGFKNLVHTMFQDEDDGEHMFALILPYPTQQEICDMSNKLKDYKSYMSNPYAEDGGMDIFGGMNMGEKCSAADY